MRTVHQLAREIAKLRRRRPKTKYRVICKELEIFKADGVTEDPGMAKLIQDGYVPRKASTRARLGLAEATTCPSCHRPLKKKRSARKVRASKPSPLSQWWGTLPGSSKGDDILHMEGER